jgi:hypothetical protein
MRIPEELRLDLLVDRKPALAAVLRAKMPAAVIATYIRLGSRGSSWIE